jgi:DNA-binding transcriptional regulator YdaS (Cro superfamily)
MNKQQALAEAIRIVGSKVKMAAAVGASPQAVGQWKECPAERVLAVERAVKKALGKKKPISRYQLRPDIYGKK